MLLLSRVGGVRGVSGGCSNMEVMSQRPGWVREFGDANAELLLGAVLQGTSLLFSGF